MFKLKENNSNVTYKDNNGRVKFIEGRGGDTPAYTGVYEFTPTAEAQTVPISGKKALQDIVINAIPNNYGLITYNGFSLSVT